MTAPPATRLHVGTRASRLARVQTGAVAAALRAAHPDVAVLDVVIDTAGDRDRATPLPEIGGKGVFTDELERALRDGRIDLAVHSLKDLPVGPSPGLVLAAIPAREDARDVLVAAQGMTLAALPHGARAGTCSTRRTAQLLALRPDLTILPLRGNVDTRVRKVRDGEYDAIVLAAAGLHRLGLGDAITEYLPLADVLPAPGQGALAVQCRADDHGTRALLAALDDPDVRVAVEAERAFLEGLGGGCAAPVAAFASVADGTLHLTGVVSGPDGRRAIHVTGSGAPHAAAAVGHALADDARGLGAAEFL